jgi:uncharacterized protein (DUF608 family)
MLCSALPAVVATWGLVIGASLFDASADPRILQQFHVEGLQHAAAGTVYPAGALEDGGMPLGGVGTGYLCLDTDGRFGKCSIFNRYPAPLTIGQPFLTMTVDGKPLTVAAPREGRGDAKAVHYFGHFPVADARFEFDAPIRVELRAMSPFIPGDVTESNTPAAYFEVTVINTSDTLHQVTLAFAPEGFPKGEAATLSEGSWQGVQVAHVPVDRMPDWMRHTYAIAVDEGTADMSDTGPRAVASCELPAGTSKTVRFILAWHQPYVREGSGRVEQHMYAQRLSDAQAVARHAVAQHAAWLRRVLAWQDVIYGSDLPAWLQETLINAPYALTKNSLWLARTRPDDWWDEQGLFLVNESFSTCSLTETMPCRFFGHWPALFFFPELELSTLKAIRHFQLRDGEPPFCLGLGFAIRDPRYHCQHTCGAGEYAQMIYRYYLRTGDEQFLRDFWESARDAIAFMMSLDKDGDGLVEDHAHAIQGESFPANNPMDNWPWYGASSYTAGKGLATLMCGIQMARTVGDPQQVARWTDVLARGQRSFDAKLWTGTYYRTYNDPATGRCNDACPAMQLSCLWCTRVLGVGDPLPPDRITPALDTIARLNIPASPFGMVNAVFADGKPCVEGAGSGIADTCWSRDIFTQCNATAAMAFVYGGRRAEGELAAKTMMDTIFRGPHAMPWAQPCGLSSKTGGTCHGHDYYDHMVVWSYPLAFLDQNIAAACAPGGFIYDILQSTRQ